jgi:hypothetical protein
VIDPESGRQWLGVAIFIIVVSIVLMVSLPSGSAEFVVSILSLLVGVILLVGLVIVIRKRR